jgi:hypothetical protein
MLLRFAPSLAVFPLLLVSVELSFYLRCVCSSGLTRLSVNSYVNFFNPVLFQQFNDDVYFGTFSRAVQSELLCQYVHPSLLVDLPLLLFHL